MKLRRVRIFGFKTFAERTDLELDGDLIAIVGPNGCGKSNIVDAILWALGEPHAKALRAQTNTDVICNGSEKRKPMGYAEVTLTFDNEDGALPIPLAEVTVSRRLTRAGDSTYSINRRTCRQKDVHDLFADSGLGRTGYAIVGQRDIDQALSASSTDRRAWLDEAAGVQRFRAKRQESMRRLDEAEEHLERVEGILNDIDAQRLPLEADALVARRYLELKDVLTTLETGLLAQDIRRAQALIEESEAKIAEAMDKARLDSERAHRHEAETKRLGDDIAEFERKMDALRELRQAKLTESERESAEEKLARQKHAALDELEQNLDREREIAANMEAEAAADVEVARAEHGAAKEALQSLLAEGSTKKDDARAAEQALKEVESELARAREAQTKAQRSAAERAQDAERRAWLRKEQEGISGALPDLEKAIADANSQAAEARARLDASRERLKETTEQQKSGMSRSAEREATLRDLLARQAALGGKRRGLEATIESHDGLNQGSAAVLGLVRSRDLPDVYRPVASALVAETDVALAIETALGGAAHDLIVPHEEDAKAAIRLLKDRRLGRATFQPISLVSRQYRGETPIGCLGRRGIVGRASDLVECEPSDRPVIDSLLGRVVVAETLDDALAHSDSQGWNRMVTLDGEVLHRGGAVTGGRAARSGTGMVQRRAELQEVERELDDLAEGISKHQAALEKDREAAKAAEGLLAGIRTEIEGLEAEFREAEKWRHQIELEIQATNREQDRLLREITAIEERLAQPITLAPDVEPLEAKRTEAMAKVAALTADAGAMLMRRREAEESVQRCASRLSDAERRHRSLADQQAHRAKRLGGLDHEREHLLKTAENHRMRAEAASQEAERMGQEVQETAKTRQQLLEQSFQLAEAAKLAREAASATAEQVRQSEIERAKAESRRANAVQRLLEEYGAAPEDIPDGEPLPAEAPLQVTRLRKEMRDLGTVNLGAIEAYERLSSRHAEMSLQHEDLVRSKDEVLAAVRELDRLTRDRFTSTLAKVNEQFQIFFGRLFGGGEAAIELEDPESVLTSGVRIDVMVPGKKRQRLELLSGGERSLCACAFLFALLSVRPAPLVVLDEVDAPLDGRNVERFVETLSSFKEQTQFVLITHNPVTIAAAPIWFGVTMQEPGVTRVLPYKAPEVVPEIRETSELALTARSPVEVL